METKILRQALLRASVSDLEDVINWLRRPWAPEQNDSLRAAWHEARRSEGARRALAFALEDQVRNISQPRDVVHVGTTLHLDIPTSEAIVAEIARRLGAVPVRPFQTSPDSIVAVLGAAAEVARALFAFTQAGHRARPGRRHRHGR